MLPTALAIDRGAVEMIVFLVVDKDANIAADEQVFAPLAKARLVKGPPLLEGIVRSHDLQLSSGRGDEGRHSSSIAMTLISPGLWDADDLDGLRASERRKEGNALRVIETAAAALHGRKGVQ